MKYSTLLALGAAMSLLPACAAVKTTGKVAAMPVKGAYTVGKYGAKGAYHGTRLTAKTAAVAGKGTVAVVKAPFQVAGAMIDTTEQVVDIAKDAAVVSKEARVYAEMFVPKMDIETEHGTIVYNGNRLSFKRDEIEKVKDVVGNVTDAVDIAEKVDEVF